ncbi:MAG TPA: glycosyltransferase [Candidatus Solibacter sp.]|nr:glycosyltransferase [Candidatus Solibacter sp.]
MSVLICTLNRPSLLARSLCALVISAQQKPDQVIVVNGGDDETDEVVEPFVGFRDMDVKLVKTVNKNLAASRNVGLPHCQGDIIAMTDDDAEVFPDWIAQMKRAHCEHPEAGAVGGPVLGTNTDSLVGKIAEVITFPSWLAPRYVRTLPGVNISYKREVVEKIGPQDENLFRGEDVDYNARVQEMGYKVYFDPAIQVHHYHRPTFKGLLNQHYMYGRAYYLVRRKWPEMYCVYPHELRRPKDFLKAINFVGSLLYQPFLSARQVPFWGERMAAVPLLFLAGLSWKGGMVAQACRGFLAAQGAAAARTTEPFSS